jgi:hypothetical protein
MLQRFGVPCPLDPVFVFVSRGKGQEMQARFVSDILSFMSCEIEYFVLDPKKESRRGKGLWMFAHVRR